MRAWRQWIAMFAVGAVLLALLSLAAVWLVRPRVEAGPLQAWDRDGLLWVAEVTPMPFPQAMWIGATGDIIFLLPLVLITVILAVRRRAIFTAATMLTGYTAVTGLLWVGWSAWNRPRPDLIAEGIAAPGLHSFPSGHMLVSVPVYGLLCYLWCAHTRSWTERMVAIVLTTFFLAAMAWARLVVGVHWPTDVIAGAILGLVWLVVQIVALRRGEAAAEASSRS
jgi:membrane-associated phospholipid phosphatase